jgi:outer membrane biosynthesis protein TonB
MARPSQLILVFGGPSKERPITTTRTIGWYPVLLIVLGLVLPRAARAASQEPACSPLPSDPPVPARVVAPRYPDVALEARVQGVVSVALGVAPTGSVNTVTPCRNIPTLTAACSRAAKQWTFAPTDTSASRRAIVTCRFLLGDADVDPVAYVAPGELQIHGRLPNPRVIE